MRWSVEESNVRLAEVHQQRGEECEAGQLLRAALGMDPQCDPARRGLVEILRGRGHAQFNAGRIAPRTARPHRGPATRT